MFRPEPATDDYQRPIERASGSRDHIVAAVPLLSGDVTTGVLGFVKYGDRNWRPEELNAVKAIASLFAQVQARVLAEEQLRYLAEHDDLTGLHNRRALLAHLDARLAEWTTGARLDLVFRSRPPQDDQRLPRPHRRRLVHPRPCRTAEEAAEGPNLIARLGGDEFVVVPTTPMDADTAEALAYRLQSTLCERVAIDGETLTRTVSIGVALGVPGRDTTSDLLRRADQAVLTAKNSGGNKVAVFSDDMSLENEFRNDIELHLQSVIESGLTAVALSARGRHAHRRHPGRRGAGALGASHPRTSLTRLVHRRGRIDKSRRGIGPLGDASCMRRVRPLAVPRVGHDTVLRINVSPVQLVTDGFVESVASIIAEFGLDGGSVCLEITESVVVQDIETTRITLAGLKQVGVQVAIDDFGTGYSVLSHLKSLPVDTLKIDRGFVRDLGSNPGDLAIVRAIIALAEAFGLELVAEGVETQTAALTLLRHGCYRAQGFLLSRPVVGDAMEALLARGRIPVDFSAAPSL